MRRAITLFWDLDLLGWRRWPAARFAWVTALIALSSGLVYLFPRSLLAFLLFQACLLVIYYADIGRPAQIAFGAIVLGLLMPWIGTVNGYYLEVATQVGIFVALALGLNIVVGLAGLLDLGYVAFYAVGAYLWAIFGSRQAAEIITSAASAFPLSPMWFFVFMILGVLVAALTGVLLGLPVLRLRGDYLAIVTLGFGEVVRVLANNLDKPINITNGPKGITPIQRPPLFFQPVLEAMGLEATPSVLYPLYFYFLVLLVVVTVTVVTQRLDASHIGRAWTAIREDELAAVSMGIPLVRMKLLAFACGASFAGVMGVLFASKQFFINPESFTFLESIGVLAMIILGGIGSIPGAILGATLVTVLNLQVLKGISLWLNALRSAGTEIWIPLIGSFPLASLPTQLEPAKYERMVFGVILVLMMIYRPQGILPSRRRRRELSPSGNEVGGA